MKITLKELDVVVTTKNIKDIPSGTKGVIVFSSPELPEIFFVELFNKNNKTIGLETVKDEDLELLESFSSPQDSPQLESTKE